MNSRGGGTKVDKYGKSTPNTEHYESLVFNFILQNNKPSYAVYIKNSLHYTFTDLKQVYVQDKPLSFPVSSLGEVDKAVVRNTINLSMMNFFDATFKDKEFEKILYKNYENEVIFIYNEN